MSGDLRPMWSAIPPRVFRPAAPEYYFRQLQSTSPETIIAGGGTAKQETVHQRRQMAGGRVSVIQGAEEQRKPFENGRLPWHGKGAEVVRELFCQ